MMPSVKSFKKTTIYPLKRHKCSIWSTLFFLQLISIIIIIRNWIETSNLNSSKRRFDHYQWPVPSQTPVLSRGEQRNRVFISSTHKNCSDGMGHRFGMINFDLQVTRDLNVGYAHRRSRYKSLSPDSDEFAVERLFGWSVEETRDDVLETSCEIIDYDQSRELCDDSEKGGPICVELKTREQGGQFDHLVYIPSDLTDCYLNKTIHNRICAKQMASFAEKHNESHTMFQMFPTKCGDHYRIGNYRSTKQWFIEKYWSFHQGRTGFKSYNSRQNDLVTTHRLKATHLNQVETLNHSPYTRLLSFNPQRVQVGVHIRRGDFLNYTDRTLVTDETFTEVISDIKQVGDEVFQKDLPIDIHIYSEGIPNSGNYHGNHNVHDMIPLYVTDQSKIVNATEYWNQLIGNCLANRSSFKRDTKPLDIQVFAHIATDTISAIHEMISADIFVGSESGLSMHIVETYARGYLILPSNNNLRKFDGRRMDYYAIGKHEHYVRLKDLQDMMRHFTNRYMG